MVRTRNSQWSRDDVQCPYREGRVRKVRSSVLKSDDDSLEVDNIERREDDFTKEIEFCLGNYSKTTI